MNILFLYPEKMAGTKAYAENVILAIKKNIKDINLNELIFKEYEKEEEYNTNNNNILSICVKNNINLVHFEFDFGYFGFKFGNKPFLDLINKLTKININYTISMHNSVDVFLKGMKILNKNIGDFSKIINFFRKEPIERIIVHNPLFNGNFAPLLPIFNLKCNWNEKIDLKSKDKIIIGLSGFLHKGKNYDEFLKFAKSNKQLFLENNIVIKAQFNERKDRLSKDRIDYKETIKKYKDTHIEIEIVYSNNEKYRSFLNSIDVGVVTHSVLSQSGTITDYIYNGKPVLAKENYNNLYLNFIELYNNKDYLYYFIKNIRQILLKYAYDEQKLFCEKYDDKFVAQIYRLSFIKNMFSNFKLRLAVGALCYYKNKLILFKKHNIPFYDIMHGGIEGGESNINALKREIMEELNISLNDFTIGREVCDFEYIKPLKTQLKVSNVGAKVKVYNVILNKAPNLPTKEIESYKEYSSNLTIYENTKELIKNV